MKHTFGLRSGKGVYEEVVFGNTLEILGAPKIYKSQVLSGLILGSPVIELSKMDGDMPVIADYASVYMSRVMDTSRVVGNASVIGSSIYNDARVFENAVVHNSCISEHAVIRGTATILFCEINGWADIHEGIWARPPLHFVATGGWSITEGIDDKVTVSCTSNKISKWLSGAGRRYGKLVGMPKEQIDEVQHWVEVIAKAKGIKC